MDVSDANDRPVEKASPGQRVADLLRHPRFQLYALVVLAGFLRLPDLGSKSLWVDEARGLRVNAAPLEEITQRCRNDHTPPLREYALHALGKGSRNRAAVASRMPSAVAGILVVGAVFLMGRYLFGDAAGLCAGLFLVGHPWLVLHSQDSRMHVVSLLFSALVLFLLCRLLYRTHTWSGWALLGALTALYAWFTYISFVVFLSAAALIVIEWLSRLARKERRRDAHRLLAGALLGGVVFLVLYGPWIHAMGAFTDKYLKEAPQPNATPQAQAEPAPEKEPAPKPLPVVPLFPVRMDFPTVWNFLHRLGGDQQGAAVLAFVLALAGAGVLAARHRGLAWIVPCWFLTPVPLFLLTSAKDFFPPRYVLHFLTVYSLLVGLGAASVFEWVRRALAGADGRRRAFAACVAGLVALGPLLAFQSAGLVRYYRGEKQNWRDATAYIERHARPGDKVLIGYSWAMFGVLHYLDPRPKRLRVVAPRLPYETFVRELESETNVWYIHWVSPPLPFPVNRVAESQMDVVKSYPGFNGDVRVLRKKTYKERPSLFD